MVKSPLNSNHQPSPARAVSANLRSFSGADHLRHRCLGLLGGCHHRAAGAQLVLHLCRWGKNNGGKQRYCWYLMNFDEVNLFFWPVSKFCGLWNWMKLGLPRKNGIQNDSFKGVQKIIIDLIIGLLDQPPKIRSLLALTYLLQSSIACYWLPVIAIYNISVMRIPKWETISPFSVFLSEACRFAFATPFSSLCSCLAWPWMPAVRIRGMGGLGV